MTNFRITLCDYHHLGEFKFCFTCGAPLVKAKTLGPPYSEGEYADVMWVCEREPVHLKVFAENREHKDPDNDFCEDVKIE